MQKENQNTMHSVSGPGGRLNLKRKEGKKSLKIKSSESKKKRR